MTEVPNVDEGLTRPLIFSKMADVMFAVKGVAKRDENTHQKFKFRGIDAILNAVGPILRDQRVLVYPVVRRHTYEQIEVGSNRTLMGHAVVEVAYVFTAEDGSSIQTIVVGEATDSGDKAYSKAMSVAFRTAMIQALALPTDEPDPDSETHERAPSASQLIYAIGTKARELGSEVLQKVAQDWASDHDDQDIRHATDTVALQAVLDSLQQRQMDRATGRPPAQQREKASAEAHDAVVKQAEDVAAAELGATKVES